MEPSKQKSCRDVLRKIEAIMDWDLESVKTLLHILMKEVKEYELEGTIISDDLILDTQSVLYEADLHLQNSQRDLLRCCTVLYDDILT